MSSPNLYPLRFEPIFQYRLWGARRLGDLLGLPLPGDGPIGEAWILSDRDDFPSLVADGPLKGQTIKQLLEQFKEPMLGVFADQFDRFPLLLKFLDSNELLSVQVHPSDAQKEYLPPGEHGKTEAWIVLQTSDDGRIYAGLMPGTTPEVLRQSLANHTATDHLASFVPKLGDGVFLQAGTVHSFGGLVVFEVQENSDVTFRLSDWDRVDATTGKPRPLQIESALACINFSLGPLGPSVPTVESTAPVHREKLFDCEHFRLWRMIGESPFEVGSNGVPRVIVALAGSGQLAHSEASYPVERGNVMLLPASVGECRFTPAGECTILEIALPGEK